jgi:hypothetical protein
MSSGPDKFCSAKFLVSALVLVGGPTPVQAEELRDPFVFGPTYEGSARQSIREGLTGILWDATNPLAVIGGQPVTVGETVAGWKVVEIKPDRVVIQRDFDRVTLIPGSPWPAD